MNVINPALPCFRDSIYTAASFALHGPGKEPGMALPPTSSPHAVAAPVGRPPQVPVFARPRLSVVIVNYRQWDETSELVRQLVAADSTQRGLAEVVVVDNHSPRHPAITRLRRMPH